VSFARVLGHDRIKRILGKALAQGRFPPALLLAGPEGVGKRTLALATARGLVCEAGGGEACGACSTCRRVAKSLEGLPALRKAADDHTDEPERRNFLLHPDLVLVEPRRTATRLDIRIEQVRDLLRHLQGRPFEARARAFVIDDAHAMTEQAQNALLKGLEEPPATSHVLLVTASPQALLPTIRSRCQVLRLGSLPAAVVEGYLRTEAGLEPDEARLRAALAGGSLGAALAFESEAYRSLREELLALLEQLAQAGGMERLEAAEALAQSDDLTLALTALRSLLRDVAALGAGAAPGMLLNADVAGRLVALARGRLGARASALAETVGETRESLRGSANKVLTMDVLLDALAG
jgi:DNA polymerase III subunit delta'